MRFRWQRVEHRNNRSCKTSLSNDVFPLPVQTRTKNLKLVVFRSRNAEVRRNSIRNSSSRKDERQVGDEITDE